MDRPTMDELRERIAASARFYGGTMPRDAALVWDGYFAALLEWGLISPDNHSALLECFPNLLDRPVMGLFLGWCRTE